MVPTTDRTHVELQGQTHRDVFMTAQDQADQISREQSSQWIEILKRENQSDVKAFAHWLLESQRHVRDFLLMTALDEELKYIDPACLLPVERFEPSVEDVNEESPSVALLEAYRLKADTCTRHPVRARFRGRQLAWWLFIIMLVTAGLIGTWTAWNG